MKSTVASPHTAFAHQCGSICRSGTRATVNIKAITAMDSMEYITTIFVSCTTRLRQFPCGAADGWLIASSFSMCMMFFGSLFSSRLYAGVDSLIIYGVRNVVITDTATTTGYRKLPMTPSDSPNDAMINENSPICAIEKPHCMADFKDCPLMRKPKEPNTACPTRMVSTSTIIGTL